MNNNNRTILIVIIIILALCLCCIVGATLAGAGLLIMRSSGSPTSAPVIIEETSIPSPSEPEISPTAEPQSSTLDPAIAKSMDEIQAQVSEIRGLDPTKDVPRKLLSPEQLSDKVTTDFFSDYTPEEASRDRAVLNLLGLLPADFDLLDFYTRLYSEQIAGFYDDEEKAMYVVADGDFTGVERDTYAHEFTHALQDQYFDFNGALNYTEEACEEDSERCAAVQALMEGDATLTEMLWLQQHATASDIQDLQRYYQDYESPIFDSAPAFMQKDFLFAYEKGYEFVQVLYAQDGFASIDAAFSQTNPVSTEQILHPARYPEDVPMPVELPDLSEALGAGWEEVERNVVGEWYTWLILAMGEDPDWRLAEDLAWQAAEGWGGDAYSVLENSQTGETAMIVRTIWDSTSEGVEAYAAFEDYTALRFSKADVLGVMQADGVFASLLRDEGSGFTWLLAQNPETLLRLIAELD